MIIENDETWPFWIQQLDSGNFRLGLAEGWLENSPEVIIGLELAPGGSRIRSGDSFGFLHLSESMRELRAPFDFEVVAANESAVATATLLRDAPYGRGWLLELRRT